MATASRLTRRLSRTIPSSVGSAPVISAQAWVMAAPRLLNVASVLGSLNVAQ